MFTLEKLIGRHGRFDVLLFGAGAVLGGDGNPVGAIFLHHGVFGLRSIATCGLAF